VKAAAAKQAAIECSSEKRFSAPRAFPIRQTGGEEEVTNEGQSEKEARNKERESDFEHRSDEKPKHHATEPAVRTPGCCVFGINPVSLRLVRTLLQTFQNLQTSQLQTTP
jgi:hypothetical protein